MIGINTLLASNARIHNSGLAHNNPASQMTPVLHSINLCLDRLDLRCLNLPDLSCYASGQKDFLSVSGGRRLALVVNVPIV